jgi:hypothetical protein
VQLVCLSLLRESRSMFVPILIGIDNPETVAGVDDGQAASPLAGLIFYIDVWTKSVLRGQTSSG